MNRGTVIGLFHGMFEKNILTFNPGLDSRPGEMDEFTDVREIQRTLKEMGIALTRRRTRTRSARRTSRFSIRTVIRSSSTSSSRPGRGGTMREAGSLGSAGWQGSF